MQIRIIPVTPLQQNCSLIWDTATKHAAFVDPGGDIDTLLGVLTHFGLTLKRIWLTHGHLDHAGAAAGLRERTGVPVEGPHPDESFWIDQLDQQGRMFGLPGARRLAAGQLINIDVSAEKNGYFGDTGASFILKASEPRIDALCRDGRRALAIGLVNKVVPVDVALHGDCGQMLQALRADTTYARRQSSGSSQAIELILGAAKADSARAALAGGDLAGARLLLAALPARPASTGRSKGTP
mgnify:CR=1 FL=1